MSSMMDNNGPVDSKKTIRLADVKGLANAKGLTDVEELADVEKSLSADVKKSVVLYYKYQYLYKCALQAKNEFLKFTFTNSQ